MGIRNSLKELKKQNEMALIAFVMAALPDENLCLDCIKALEQGGCDILELGSPFSDPLADGETIERFHHRGTARGLNLRRSLDFAHRVSQVCRMPLILFSYYNPIHKIGLDAFAAECRAAGINGLIVPDLPLDEMQVFEGLGLESIPMVAPSSSEERMQMAAAMNPAFIYCVSVRGVTGVRTLPEKEIQAYLQRVKNYTNAPLELGFGISRPEQLKAFKGYADGVVVGSYFAQLIEEYEARPDLLPGKLEKAAAVLKAAARDKH